MSAPRATSTDLPAFAKPIRVCVVNASPFVFGAEKSMAYAAARISPEGSVRFSLVSPGGDAERLFLATGTEKAERAALERFQRTADPLRLLRQGSAWLSGNRRVLRAMRSLRPDVIHANGIHSLLYVMQAKRRLRIPVVWHVRDAPRDNWIFRMCAKAADVLIAPSETMKSLLSDSGRPVHYIANPIFPERVDFSLSSRHAGSHRFRIALIGQMIPRKGHVAFLEALRRVLDETADVEAWFVGDDPFEPESPYVRNVRSRVSGSRTLADRVRFLGRVDDMVQIYRSVDAVAIPSSEEPFGRVALEGMAYGCAVIASRTGGLAEIVRDGENGLLFESWDSEALADRILSLARSVEMRETLRRNGLATYAQYEERVDEGVERLRRLYLDLVRRAGSPTKESRAS